MAGAVNTIGQSKRGGGDRSSRPAQLQARENEQKALSLWIKGATFQQIAAAGFGIATASGAWRSVGRALARIPKQEADQAREAQLVRLQAVRMLLWNQASADPIRAAEALIKNLAASGAPSAKVSASLKEMGFDENIRAENLSPSQFGHLCLQLQ